MVRMLNQTLSMDSKAHQIWKVRAARLVWRRSATEIVETMQIGVQERGLFIMNLTIQLSVYPDAFVSTCLGWFVLAPKAQSRAIPAA